MISKTKSSLVVFCRACEENKRSQPIEINKKGIKRKHDQKNIIVFLCGFYVWPEKTIILQ